MEYYIFLYRNLFEFGFDDDSLQNNSGIINIIEKIKESKLENSNNSGIVLNSNANPPDQNFMFKSRSPNTFKNIVNQKKQKIQQLDEQVKEKKEELSIKEFDVVINKDIHKLLKFKNKVRKTFVITRCDRCKIICCLSSFGKNESEDYYKNAKIVIAKEADRLIRQRSEIFELWKSIDNISLFKKLILNQNQCFMIKNKCKKLLVSDGKIDLSSLKKLKDKELQKQVDDLCTYLKKRKDKKTINAVDYLLFDYCEDKVKEKVNNTISFT